MQRDMDEYIDQLLAEMPEPTQTNILDKPIPRAVKQGLLKPLLLGKPRPSRPPRMRKDRKRKAILDEFDPLPPQKAVRTIQGRVALSERYRALCSLRNATVRYQKALRSAL